MMVSTKGRYALRMMIDLASQPEGKYISLGDIAQRQGISKKYLEQIVPVLNNQKLLSTTRGAGGGYRLKKSPGEYTVGSIIRATEGAMAPVSCLEDDENTCPRSGECATLFVWAGLQKVVDNYLDGITLQDIVDRIRHS